MIDNDPANRYLLSWRLQRTTAANSATGLELPRSGAFDLVLLDMINAWFEFGDRRQTHSRQAEFEGTLDCGVSFEAATR